MSYNDLRDFLPEYIVAVTNFTGVDTWRIQLEVMGGGTVGKAYAGRWRYIVSKNGEEIDRGQDFTTGMPHTHREAAIELISFYTNDVTPYDFKYASECFPEY